MNKEGENTPLEATRHNPRRWAVDGAWSVVIAAVQPRGTARGQPWTHLAQPAGRPISAGRLPAMQRRPFE
jgi:hypothetical protein